MPLQDQPTGIEVDPVDLNEARPADSGPETFRIPGRHFRLTAVEFRDQSDLMNAYVHERTWLMHANEVIRLSVNLFCVEALDQDKQWMFVCTAPLSHVWPRGSDCDVTLRLLREGGLQIDCMETLPGGSWTRLETEAGPLARARTLQDWQRSLRPQTASHRVPAFLSNTWGDRSKDGRMNEAFMLEEIEAAARLGVDVVQLDDGWQKGVTSNSVHADRGGVWEGFWNADPAFWTVHPERFPNGLEPVAALAAQKGVSLGLWFAPDSWNDLVHWERDADTLLAYFHRFGVEHFKLDGIKLHSETALERLRSFVRKVHDGSGGRVVFDLDITAESRPGHFGLIECGPLFVENRYTDWISYWPHFTLRNVWQLARWVDPLRLRFELLNPDRNPQNYGGDALAPAAYRGDALFASVMCTNPLGWFEVSGLTAERANEIQGLVSIWKQHREKMAEGTLLPIGACPDGHNHSGFLIVPRTPQGTWYLLLFRGNTSEAGCAWHLPVDLPGSWRVLAGQGEVSACGRTLTHAVAHPLGYVFADSGF